MKTLSKFLVIFTILVFIPASSYALIDFGVYGGFAIGDYEYASSSYDVAGTQYGFIGHFTGGIPLLISFGVGGFYQKASYTVELPGSDEDFDKNTYGFDAFAQLEVIPIIHPYIRGGLAIKDKIDSDNIGSDDESFKSLYYGLGVAVTVAPMIQIFGECILTSSTFEDDTGDTDISTTSFNLGAKISI